MSARKDKNGRRMNNGHYVQDAFFFIQDLHGSLLMHEVKEFSQNDARYAQRLLEELDEIRPELQKLANNLEANMPEVLTTWQDF
tara:strand:+ start:792 stop:1043 length:252 start_codon:yes stop_codon:yes gene_type:complete